MTPEPFTTLALVVKTHGLKGEVAVEPAADLPFVLPHGLEVWFVPPPSRIRSGLIEDVRRGPKGPLVKLTGVDEIGAAEELVGRQMVARSGDLPPELLETPLVEPDAVGLSVVDEVHGSLGEVVDVIITGANDVWVVDGPLGEVLLPVIDECVLSVDWDGRVARVRLLPGLLPEESDA